MHCTPQPDVLLGEAPNIVAQLRLPSKLDSTSRSTHPPSCAPTCALRLSCDAAAPTPVALAQPCTRGLGAPIAVPLLLSFVWPRLAHRRGRGRHARRRSRCAPTALDTDRQGRQASKLPGAAVLHVAASPRRRGVVAGRRSRRARRDRRGQRSLTTCASPLTLPPFALLRVLLTALRTLAPAAPAALRAQSAAAPSWRRRAAR